MPTKSSDLQPKARQVKQLQPKARQVYLACVDRNLFIYDVDSKDPGTPSASVAPRALFLLGVGSAPAQCRPH